MPRSIKPRMSKDELISFDSLIDSVEYVDGEVVVTIYDKSSGNYIPVHFFKMDLEDMLQFIRRNQV